MAKPLTSPPQVLLRPREVTPEAAKAETQQQIIEKTIVKTLRRGRGLQTTTPTAPFSCTDLNSCSLANLGTRKHSDLTELLQDQHTIYALADKTRPSTWVEETDVPVLTDPKYPNAFLLDGSRIIDGDVTIKDLGGNIGFLLKRAAAGQNEFYISSNSADPTLIDVATLKFRVAPNLAIWNAFSPTQVSSFEFTADDFAGYFFIDNYLGGGIREIYGRSDDSHAYVDITDGTADILLDTLTGITLNKDIEHTDALTGVILKDRTTGTRYRLYVDNGVLGIEPA